MNRPATHPTTLYRRPNWPPLWRAVAVVLWSGFLGAALLLLALLIGWDALAEAGDTPGFALLAIVFTVGWIITAITAVMALSLAAEPRRQIRAETPETRP